MNILLLLGLLTLTVPVGQKRRTSRHPLFPVLGQIW